MIWRCIDRSEPQCDHACEFGWFMEYEALKSHGIGYGIGLEYMIGYDPNGDGCGVGFDHGMLIGDNVKWGDR